MTLRNMRMSGPERALRAGQTWLTDNTLNVGYYERMASAVGGPLLALYGLSRRSPGGLGLALIEGSDQLA